MNPEQPPVTGNPAVDAALAGLAGISGAPIDEQLDRLGAAHEALVRVLESSREAAQPSPPATRPR